MKYKHYDRNLKIKVVQEYLNGGHPKELAFKYNLKSGA
ncbi:hypothetical protein ELUCI_v1c00800 [Williamsoniiplasma lucivorax]|uniref:Transposase n=1 Tax=Williamsoniiplasma lucivorax TaxID=209274 RepID=A0A2S5REZ8_9MOLU|nr:hypothetical protein ELUCI_v1c00800 [Williamsoniiplasma lucivorax]